MGKQAFDAPRSQIFMFLPQELTIVVDPQHWLYDPRVDVPPDAAFLADIEERGIVQPIVVFKEDDKVLVVAGRRRVRAAQMINEQRRKGSEPIRVPCWQRKGDEAELYATAVAENVHRRNDSLAETVAKATRLTNLIGDPKRVASVMGKTVQQVSRLLKVNELHKSVRAALYKNLLGLDAALQFHGMPLPEQAGALEKLLKSAGAVVTPSDSVGGSAVVTVPSTAATSPAAAVPSQPPGTKPVSPQRSAAASRRQMSARKHPIISGREVKEHLGKKQAMRSQREVEERLAIKTLPPDYRSALLWVLHRDTINASAPPSSTTKVELKSPFKTVAS